MNNDHDLLIELNTKSKYILEEIKSLRDDSSKRLDIVESKIAVFNQLKVERDAEMKRIEERSEERFKINGERISKLETFNSNQVTKVESNRAYIFRKVFEWLLPLIVFIVALLLVKVGLISPDFIK